MHSPNSLTYIDINALAQGIYSFLASQVWFQAVAGARTYGTDSSAIISHPYVFLYICMYMYVYMCVFMNAYVSEKEWRKCFI